MTLPVTATLSRVRFPVAVPASAEPKGANHEFSPCLLLLLFHTHPSHTLPHAPLHLLSRLECTDTTQLPWRSPAVRRQLSTQRRERGSHRPPGRAPHLARRGAAPKMVRKIRTGVFPNISHLHRVTFVKKKNRVDYVEQVEEILAATHAKGARASVTTSQVS